MQKSLTPMQWSDTALALSHPYVVTDYKIKNGDRISKFYGDFFWPMHQTIQVSCADYLQLEKQNSSLSFIPSNDIIVMIFVLLHFSNLFQSLTISLHYFVCRALPVALI